MTTYAEAAKAAGTTLDEAMILQTAATKLLVAAVRGEVDLNALARRELANRGMDNDGKWIGFGAAG